MEKLVRDKIPEIMEAAGVKCNYRIANEAEFKDALWEKLSEEFNEFTENPCEEEAADVLTVMIAIIEEHYGECEISIASVLDAYSKKAIERGKFNKRIIAKFDK